MSNNFYFRHINLQLFAEGGDGGTGADGATAVNGGIATSNAKNPLANVKYGIQDGETPAKSNQPTTDDGVDLDAEFEELIKGKYKDQYNKRTQDTVQKRLKGTKETVDKYNELTPTLEMLAKKYGVDATDIKALNQAIEEDDSYYEEEALEKGITVEQVKSIHKMERENADLRRQMEERQRQEKVDQDIARWMEESKEVVKTFPSFNLGEELKNPQFIAMIQNGVDLSSAYFALHNRELVPQAMQYAIKTSEQKITNKIIANGSRPTESGVNSQSSAVVKSDVSQLSKADRQEIMRRVARGEKIRF